jgi:hypothetical protein
MRKPSPTQIKAWMLQGNLEADLPPDLMPEVSARATNQGLSVEQYLQNLMLGGLLQGERQQLANN